MKNQAVHTIITPKSNLNNSQLSHLFKLIPSWKNLNFLKFHYFKQYNPHFTANKVSWPTSSNFTNHTLIATKIQWKRIKCFTLFSQRAKHVFSVFVIVKMNLMYKIKQVTMNITGPLQKICVLHHNRTQKHLWHFFLNILQKYYQLPILGSVVSRRREAEK